MKKQKELLLSLLKEHGESFGLDLVKLSNGKLKRGTIYVWLNELREDGLVERRIVPTIHGMRHAFRLKET